MPYKSAAQRRKFHQLLKEGKISKTVVDEFDNASKGHKLPERIGHKTIDELRRYYKKKYK